MRFLFLFIFIVNGFFTNSQNLISDSLVGIDCHVDTGAILLSISNVEQFELNWYYKDNLLGWIDADTIVNIDTQDGDTLFSQRCGNFKLEIINALTSVFIDSVIFFIDCPLGINPAQENIKCFGDANGLIRTIGHSGSSPYFYQWYKDNNLFSSGFNDTVHDNLDIGSYMVIITDSVGCSDSLLSTISQPAQINIELINTVEINCRGTYEGAISFRIQGGNKTNDVFNKYFYYLLLGSDTISFSDLNGSSTNFHHLSLSLGLQNSLFDSIMFDSLLAGEYILHVVDDNECLMSDTFLLNEPPPYQVFSSTDFPFICESDSGFLHLDSVIGGGNISYGFLDSNLDSIYVSAGWYDIYIYDSTYSCLDTVSVRCYAQYEIIVYESIIHPLCFGDASGVVTIDSITGGNEPYDVQWGGLDPTSLIADTYSVLFVDNIGCIHTEEFLINQPDEFDPNTILSPPTCNGDSDGSIIINPSGGSGPLIYSWLNVSSSSDSIYGLIAGEYSLFVSDTLNCIDTINIILEEPQELNFLFDNYQTPVLCTGALTTVDVLINGGVGPYSLLWNDGNTDLQRVLNAGSYFCQVTDINSCLFNDTLIIEEPDSLELSLTFNYLPCDSSGSNASVEVLGGVEPITLLWSTGDTTYFIDSLYGSTYWVIAVDSCGNTDSTGYTVDPYILQSSLDADTVLPNAYIASIFNSSSVGPFSFEWQDIFGNIISLNPSSGSLCQETYFITITDVTFGCSIQDTIDVFFDLPNGIIDIETTTVFAAEDLWGHAPYTYLWDNGTILQHADLCPGNHWIEVTDSIGCMVRQDFDIEEIIITLDPASAIIECNLENLDVDIEASATGGTPPYTYQWSNGSTQNPLNLSLDPGNYSILVSDYNECIRDTTFVIATMSPECIPNVFSPNNDNINDVWSLEDTFLYSDTEVKIYGRYGRLLFQSVGYSDPWDGKNRMGNDVPDGVYFYHIEVGHGFDPIQGTVTIIR